MDKLEHYLDQVCRSVGGPRALRQHIRQELREHLRDAAAEYKAAGLSEEAALDRALEDFGGPEQVRAELEATHGHRLLPVVIDKAMQWQERTMKAKWLWVSWAHLALAGVLVLEVLWICFAGMMLVPKFQVFMHVGIIDPAVLDETGMTWMPSFLVGVRDVGNYATWIILLVVVGWALFEWRVRGDNKSFMRLSVLGTAAAGLAVVGGLMGATLVISYMLAAPPMARIARPFALEQLAQIDTSVHALGQALEKKDWDAMAKLAEQAAGATDRLAGAGVAVGALAQRYQRPTLADLRAQLAGAHQSLADALQAIRAKDAARVGAALAKFRQSYAPVQEAAKRPVG
jgi:hypothetical protein